jgi:putative ABC transport system permease protein
VAKEIRIAWAVTLLNLKSLPDRVGSSLVIVVGVAGVVGVLLAVMAMMSGLEQATAGSGRPDRAIVLSRESGSELTGVIHPAAESIIADAPGIRKGANHEPLVSPEVMAPLTLEDSASGAEVNGTIRGVESTAFAVWPELKLTAGRWFKPGLAEVVVGKGAAEQFRGLSIGDRVSSYGLDWLVVGTFETGGSYRESELITDAHTLASARHGTDYQSVTVLLETPAALGMFRDSLTSNPQLSVDVQPETDYVRRQSAQVQALLKVLIYSVGAIMGIGAVFAALNSMYAALHSRAKEIAVLRAMGFSAFSIVTAILLEAMLLALAGAAIGAIVSWTLFEGHRTNTGIGGGLPSQLVFDLHLTPWDLTAGIALGLLIGLLGGSLPAMRAVHRRITDVLGAH